MKDSKLVGLIIAWGQKEWVRPAIEQALEYCDEVMAVSIPIISEFKEFEDNTYNIFKEYSDVKLLDIQKTWPTINKAGANVLNYMLQNSKLFLPGNWVWKLSASEIYPESICEEIKSIMKDGEYDMITMKEKYFFINMQHHLKTERTRLMRVESMKDRFYPTSRWSRKGGKIYKISRETGMFHYSLLQNIKAIRAMWLVEYSGSTLRGGSHTIRWLDEIYAKYDLKNEDYWNKKSFEVNGLKTPCWASEFTADENGRLFRYGGKHPKVVEEAGLPKIKDFRKWYNNEA